ncbi:MAG: serine hydrolase [Leptospira sp.]|nr:serine hydrolase [Leptospira sp.]
MFLNKKIHVLISAFTIALFSINSVMVHDVDPPEKVKDDEKLEELLPLLERKYSAKIGVAVKELNGNKLFQYRENERFKMSSTVKVPLAAFLYYEHEKGRVEINELVDVHSYHILPGSSKLHYFANYAGLKISFKNLMHPMLTISESISADIIFEKLGGPGRLQNFIKKKIQIEGFHVSRDFAGIFVDARGYKDVPPLNERTIDWYNLQYITLSKDLNHMIDMAHQFHADDRDTTTPAAMSELLLKMHQHQVIEKTNFGELFQILRRCETGDHRIRKGLSRDVVVANKTGSWNNVLYEYLGDVGYLNKNEKALIYSVYVESTLPSDWQKGLYSENIFVNIGSALEREFLLSN